LDANVYQRREHCYRHDWLTGWRNARTGSLNNPNTAAQSQSYFDFQPTPVVNLPTLLASGAYQFSMLVAAGQTYFIDPAAATGYNYSIGAGDPNFASVLLPAIQ
jgi:hypothetical protein